jgi:hypothetical protein
MLPLYRREFNQSQFTPARYAELIDRLFHATRTKIDFRVCETPVFVPRDLMEEMAAIGRELTHQLVDSPEYMQASESAIPERHRLGNDNPRPNFMTVDFGLVRGADGALHPKLVELQAFPSLYGYQAELARAYKQVYGLDEALDSYLGGHTERSYWDLLRRVIVGDHAPENVVLLEVEPERQKTLPDFRVYEDRLGIATVDIAKVRKQGRRLWYERDGTWVPIERIFNRAIVDELERKGVTPGFDYRDDLDVEWAGHPNWYFRISKFSIPYLDHPSVPPAVFLDDWFAGIRRDRLPEDRSEILLKPLYSFAGKGIHFGPSDSDLSAIAPEERRHYLLQQRMHFEPVVATPFGMTQAEFRMMYVWPDDEREMQTVIGLARLGRGQMMGVDHNRDQEWVGGSAALFPR